MLKVDDVEQLKNYFASKFEAGENLPDIQSVADGTVYFLKGDDGVFVEHVMFNGKWHVKVIDGNDQVTLEEV